MIDRLTSQLEIPRRLRAFVRARESSLIVLAALVGAAAGVVVAVMGAGVDLLHRVLFHLDPGVRLSGLLHLDPFIAISVPLAGGILFGIARELIARWRPDREIDPIEANALHGGRMSLAGSLIVALETVWSSGVGASVGMEAGYTQLAAALPPGSVSHSGCAAPICASWSAAAPPAASPVRLVRRSPARSTGSS